MGSKPTPGITLWAAQLTFFKGKYHLQIINLKARFNGKCVECNGPIKVGKEIVKNSKGDWVHKFCSDIEEELP